VGKDKEGLAQQRAHPEGIGVSVMLIQMKVEGLLFDPRSGMYILLLQQVDGNETLPIWIGKPEADAIALALGKVLTPRPLTHDLIKNIFDGFNVKVTRIVITEIVDNTYYALIYANDGVREIAIDSRPSDAVAVALRVNAPIFVEEGVLDVKMADELEEWLKNLKPEDFGNIM
jgi:bifunctional DNase/RNase